jgi:hypothetical protein
MWSEIHGFGAFTFGEFFLGLFGGIKGFRIGFFGAHEDVLFLGSPELSN